jgi:hypothetical protein
VRAHPAAQAGCAFAVRGDLQKIVIVVHDVSGLCHCRHCGCVGGRGFSREYKRASIRKSREKICRCPFSGYRRHGDEDGDDDVAFHDEDEEDGGGVCSLAVMMTTDGDGCGLAEMAKKYASTRCARLHFRHEEPVSCGSVLIFYVDCAGQHTGAVAGQGHRSA